MVRVLLEQHWHRWGRWAFNIVFFALLVLAAYNTQQVKETQQQLHDQNLEATTRLCLTSNDARRALRSILLDAERHSPKSAHAFYARNLARIRIIHCPPLPE